MKGSLDNLERWLQDAIVQPLERNAKPADAATNILPSRHLAPRERVALYSGMYVSRLYECLETDYPALARFLGPDRFGWLVRAYLRKHPSRHYSLNMVGRHMPEFLEGDVKIARRAVLADIARLELSMSEVFDADAADALTPADIAKLSPSEWSELQLRLVPAFQLHAFEHRTNAIVTALRQEQTLPDLRRTKTWVAVYRKDWVVWRMDLSRAMFDTLSALQQSEPLGRALVTGAASFDGTPEELQAAVSRWFAEWTAEGFFAAIDRAR